MFSLSLQLKSFHNELLTQLEQKVELDSRYLSVSSVCVCVCVSLAQPWGSLGLPHVMGVITSCPSSWLQTGPWCHPCHHT